MESAAIVEGFLSSESMHGIKYAKIVADGDSSVYQKILETRPYDDLTVEKIECRNHLLRNYLNKIKELAKASDRTVTDRGMYIKMRKLIGSSTLRLRTAITKAISHRNNGTDSLFEKSKKLRDDIINGPSHIFGEHRRCSELGYFCEGRQKEGEINHVPQMMKCGLYQKLMVVVGNLADYSKHLVQNVDSNVAEHYNATVARFIGGKRINYCLKGSYQARCSAAVVAYNTGRSQYKLHKAMYKNSPGKFSKLFEERSKRKILLAKLKRTTNPKSRRRLIASHSDNNSSEHYGPLCQKPDMDQDMYDEAVKEHFKNLSLSQEDRQQIEEHTREQSNSVLWLEERRKRITASNFGIICNRRSYTNSAPLVSSLLYNYPKDSEATLYGRKSEQTAITQLSQELGKHIQKCGLFIDHELPFLGSTPDGLIDEDGIVEVKCPFAGRSYTPEEVIEKKLGLVGNLFTTNKLTKNLEIKKKHNYYFQVQGQLHVTNRQYCEFCIWTPLGMKRITIQRDDEFWKKEMVTKLTNFYNNCILPELLDPRKRRSMALREPRCIVEAQKSQKEKKH